MSQHTVKGSGFKYILAALKLTQIQPYDFDNFMEKLTAFSGFRGFSLRSLEYKYEEQF